MAKPTNLASWGTGAAPIVEPSAGVKAAGWAPNQRPPAQWFNWWMNAVYLWMVWLDAYESTVHVWTAAQSFTRGLLATAYAAGTLPGASFSSDGAYPGAEFHGDSTFAGARFYGSGGALSVGADFVIRAGDSTNTLVWRAFRESAPGVIDTAHIGTLARIYGKFIVEKGITSGNDSGGSNAAITGNSTNAAAGLKGASADAVGPAVEAVHTGTGVAFKGTNTAGGKVLTAAATGGDGDAITATAVGIGNGVVSTTVTGNAAVLTAAGGLAVSAANNGAMPTGKFDNAGAGPALEIGTGNVRMSGAVPAMTVALPNLMTPASLVKAFVSFRLHDAAGGTVDNVTGLNVSSVTYNSATGVVSINFASNFADAFYTWTNEFETIGKCNLRTIPGFSKPVMFTKNISTFTFRLFPVIGDCLTPDTNGTTGNPNDTLTMTMTFAGRQ